MDSEIAEAIHHQVLAALWECCPPGFINRLQKEGVLCRMKAPIVEDALAFALKDPAACQSPMHVLTGYTSFRALLHYRMAHTVFQHFPSDLEASTCCALISSRGLVTIGNDVFIGPHCTITQDVPANTRITLKSNLQIQRKGLRHEVPAQNPQALL